MTRKLLSSSFFCLLLIVLSSLTVFSQMPPHPSLLDRLSKRGDKIPLQLLQTEDLKQRGIDAPWADNSLLLQRSPVPNGFQRSYGPVLTPTGSYKALVILVQFSDKQKQVQPVYFDSLLFGTSTKSLRDYYRKVSYNNLDIISVNLPGAVGWTSAPQTYSYYVNGNNGFSSYPNNAQKLVEDAVQLVNPVVDFSKYDNDGDGYVDALFIVHAGPGAEFTGSNYDIWSHAWTTNTPQNVDGVQVYRYSMEPEYWQTPGDMTCGVFAHEMGHAAFGLPDLYDRDYSSTGLGYWSLMAAGSWNGLSGLGESPALPDAWSHAQMGFVTPTVINSNVTNQSITNIETSPQVFLLWKNGVKGKEYFLVENRQQTGYDTYLPGNGFNIFHVDENITTQNDREWYPGYTNNGHYLVALEQADGLWSLEKSSNKGNNGDPFPGSANKLNFDDTSLPDSKDYSSQQTFVSVRNISTSSANMTADFEITLSSPLLTILSPVGGEKWKADQTRKIIWNSALIDSINIELSTDNGSNWIPIVQKYPAPGCSYDWVIPSGINSDNCKIKLTDPVSGNNSISNNTFSIIPNLPKPKNLTADINQKTGEVKLNWGLGNGFGFYDDFNGSSTSNFIFSDNRFSVSNGYLKMNGLSNETEARVYHDEDIQDFTFEYKFKRTQGPTTYSIGAFIRADGLSSTKINTGYYICMTASGSYSVWISQNGSVSSLIPWTTTSTINTGLNVDNIVTITAEGSKITVYVNSVYLCEVTNSTYLSGKIGVWAYDPGGYTNEVLWDYVSLSDPVLTSSTNKVVSENQKMLSGGDIYTCPATGISNNKIPVIGFLAPVTKASVFQNFNIYRDGNKIGSPVDSNYTDLLTSSGIYNYTVTAKYYEGESVPTAPYTVKYNAGPAISVSSTKITSDIIGEKKDTLSFVIKNIGTGQLNYSISDTSLTALVSKFSLDKDGPNKSTRTGQIVTKASNIATWMDEIPLTGSISSGDSVKVSVIFNGINLSPGTYTGLIKINSNDIFYPNVNVQAILKKSLANMTTTDNENNLLQGIPDNDMDIYISNYDQNHPVEFNIFVDETTINSALLSIYANDVDSEYGEKDLVKLNGHTLGYLSGSESTWNASVFNVDPSWLNPGPKGKNLVQIYVDVDNGSWSAMIDWGQLVINGKTGNATFRYVNLNKPVYRPGETINVTEEIDATQPMNVKVITQLLGPAGQVISTTNRSFLATSGDEPFTENFYLSSSADTGKYKIMAVIYDLTTNVQQDIIYKEFTFKGPLVLTGQITDALTGKGISGATVSIAGLYAQTDAQGNYTINNVPEGVLTAAYNAYPTNGKAPLDVQFTDLSTDNTNTISVTKSGYSPYLNPNTLINSSGATILNLSLSPALQTGMMRIVLNWREYPVDIDAHLKTPFIQGNSYHINYSNRGSQQQPPYAMLNIDDINGYGPETITISQMFEGKYCFYVHNFSGTNGKDSCLKYSNAVVHIYTSQGLVKTINCPTSGNGLYWYVCNIDGSTGSVAEVNQITISEPGVKAVSASSLPVKDYSGVTPEAITEKAACVLPNITNWLWDFGDGNGSTEQNPVHKYQQPGVYNVKLTVSSGTQQNVLTKNSLINITQGGPLCLTSPNGGEYWQEGIERKIKWISSGVDTIKIEYTSDSCKTWNTVAEKVAASKGCYNWIIPEGVTTASKVRISSVISPGICDTSDGFYTVLSSSAHSVSIPYLGAVSGDTVVVPINVNNFDKVAAITLRMQYDPSVFNFISVLNCNSKISDALVNTQKGVVTLAWDNLSDVSLGSDKLIDLKLYYNGSYYPSTLSFNVNQCEVTNPEGAVYPVSYCDGEIYRILAINGTITYNNKNQTPLGNVKVKLLSNSNVIDSLFTDNSGRYKFSNVSNGTYKIETYSNQQWGGVNSTDALLIRRHIVSLDTLKGIKLAAADVNASSSITSADALTIRRRVAGLITSFPLNDWLFESTDIIVNNDNVVKNIKGLCSGDVNGSFNPVLTKVNPSICLINSDFLKISGTGEVKIPIKAVNEIELGAMTLILNYPEDLIEIKSVNSKANNILFSTESGKLIMLWDDIQPIKIKSNEEFLTLTVEPKENFKAGTNLSISISEESEFADKSGNLINGLSLVIPSLEISVPKEFKLSQNYPNPFNPATAIEYDIPENAKVCMEVYNIVGEKITTLVNKTQEPGSYKINWNASFLPSGVYFLRINAEGKTKSFMQIKKMSLVK